MKANIQPLPDCFVPIYKKGSMWSVGGALGTGSTKTHEIVREPDFPKPVNLGGRCLRYRLSEVMAWAESKREGAVPADSPSASV